MTNKFDPTKDWKQWLWFTDPPSEILHSVFAALIKDMESFVPAKYRHRVQILHELPCLVTNPKADGPNYPRVGWKYIPVSTEETK